MMQYSSNRRLTCPVPEGWLAVACALLLAVGCDSSNSVHIRVDSAPPNTEQDGNSDPEVAAGNSPSDGVDEKSAEAVPATDEDVATPPAADFPPAATTPPSDSATSERPIPTVPKTAASNRILDKTFDDLKFDIEPDAPFSREMLTDDLEAMFGQRIRIRGYILPTFQREGITQFILVRDDQECCFGPGAALFDCIVVEMQPGKTTNFSVKPVAVEGRFTFQELIGPDDKHLAIFHLEGESVK